MRNKILTEILYVSISVEGSSDDLDLPIKAVFMDTDFVKSNKLLSINSINWVRIMVQTAHYFYAYFKVNIYEEHTIASSNIS